MFCSFVLQTAHASYSGGNHLSTGYKTCPFRRSFPWKDSLPLFGFLARGVYLVPLLSFLQGLRHCGTLKVVKPYPKGLRFFLPLNQPYSQNTLAYELARHEHYSHLRPCEHGLSSTTLALQRLPNVMTSISIVETKDFATFFYVKCLNLFPPYIIRITYFQIQLFLS